VHFDIEIVPFRIRRADVRQITVALDYERWQEWQVLGGARRAAAGYPDRIASTEYDRWPRVYERPACRFVLYADRRLQQPDIIDTLKTAFGLNQAEVIVRSDSHYR
jgi:hypothetical protein